MPDMTPEERLAEIIRQARAMGVPLHYCETALEDLHQLTDENQRLREALEEIKLQLDKNGEWDDGCFYYNRYSASELVHGYELAQRALGRK